MGDAADDALDRDMAEWDREFLFDDEGLDGDSQASRYDYEPREVEYKHLPILAIVRETEKAWLIRLESGEQWFPKSQCWLEDDYKVLVVPDWLKIKTTPEVKEKTENKPLGKIFGL